MSYSIDLKVHTTTKRQQFVQQGATCISRHGTIFEEHLMHKKEGTTNTEKRHNF
jgi:hypothetical protein